jgi:hypothetical protein
VLTPFRIYLPVDDFVDAKSARSESLPRGQLIMLKGLLGRYALEHLVLHHVLGTIWLLLNTSRITVNERLNVLHRFSERLGYSASPESYSVSSRKEYPRRVS